MTVVGRQGIGMKASVVVVDVDGTRFLLGVTEHAVNVLHSSGAPASSTADPETPAQDFATALAGVTSIDEAAEHRLRPRRNQQTAQAGGSILSPATWKQTAAALRQIR